MICNGARALPLSPDFRTSGVLLHVTSLPSPYGIGDFGPTALSWIDQLGHAQQSCWQVLPLGPTGYNNSPYQPLSSFAGNVLLISPDWLIENELLTTNDCAHDPFPTAVVDYGRSRFSNTGSSKPLGSASRLAVARRCEPHMSNSAMNRNIGSTTMQFSAL
ncbi:MAG: 4-alpha-glucanotransferase [Candidatus Acidiferrales bacterium]